MKNDMTQSMRDDLVLLLPWYAVGKLAPEDMQSVERALASDSFLQKQLSLIEDELAADIADNQAVALPKTLTADSLLKQAGLDASHVNAAGFWHRLQTSAHALWNGPARALAAVALAVIIGQSLLVGALVMENRTAKYQLASGQADIEGALVLARFVDSATMKDISAALAREGFHIVDGPRADGFYILRIGAKSISQTQRQQALDRLKSMTGIIALALPSQ